MRTLILCLYYWLVPMMVHGVHAETIRPLFDLTRGSRRRISDYEFRTFKGVWCDVLSWLQEDPDASAVVLLGRLQEAEPDRFSRAHLRTLQRGCSSGAASWPKSWSTPRLVSPWRDPLQCRN